MASPRVVSIGDVSAGEGEKKTGYLRVPYTTSTIDLPVGIINGVKEGPMFAVTAGVHGCEYAGIDACSRIFRAIEPEKLSGGVRVCFVVNPSAFQHPTAYVNPLDNVNANRVFPGMREGTITYRMVDACFNEIISGSDYYIDLHGGDLPELLPPHVIFSQIANKKVDEMSEQMARSYGLRDICLLEAGKGAAPLGSGGVGFVPPTSGTSNFAALEKGIPCITGEVGDAHNYREDDVQIHVDGVLNVMKALGILEGEPALPPLDQRIFDKGNVYIQVNKSGLFTPLYGPGETFRQGNKVGMVTDIFGRVVEELVSPVDGFVWTLITKRSVDAGDIVYRVLLL
jgi:predicted deacylase